MNIPPPQPPRVPDPTAFAARTPPSGGALPPAGADRVRFVRDLFDETAAHYDRICQVMSLGSGQRYRRDALRRAGLQPGMRVLDVGTGTGLVAQVALTVVGAAGTVTGVDPSEGMLRESCHLGYRVVRGYAEALPFDADRFDFLSMGYALRHVSHLEAAFTDCWRVLAPGGRLALLEISRPDSRVGLWLTRHYLQSAVPFVTRVVTGSARSVQLMEYYWETIANFVAPTVVLEALRASGFLDVRRRVVHGLFSEYCASKP